MPSWQESNLNNLHRKKHGITCCFISMLVSFTCVFYLPGIIYGETHYYADTVITQDVQWSPEGSPYIIHGNIKVMGARGDDQDYPVLTITTKKHDGSNGDVEIKFYPDKGINIGEKGLYSWEIYFGALKTEAQSDSLIIFSPIDNLTEGDYWRGLYFSPASPAGASNLEGCDFRYGGNGQDSIIRSRSEIAVCRCIIQGSKTNGIYIEDADVHIDNCTIINNSNNGVYIKVRERGVSGRIENSSISKNMGDGIKIESYSLSYFCTTIIKNNEIKQNSEYGLFCSSVVCSPLVRGNMFVENGSYPVRISAYCNLTADNIFMENSSQAIEMVSSAVSIQSVVHWLNVGVPYIVINDDIKFADPTLSKAMLTIDAGTEIRFDPGLGLIIGDGGIYSQQYGYLRANGTKDNPVVFTANQGGKYWEGITFKHDRTLWGTWLNYCIVEYGGSEKSGNYEREANLYFWDCKPVENITSSTIRYSNADGIRIVSAKGIAAEIHNNNIYGNSLYDIGVDNNHPVNAELNYWGTPNGPAYSLCSSAVVDSSVRYEAWLEDEFTEPFRAVTAAADKTSFEPLTDHTEINFSFSESADWKLNILNHQFEQIWSVSGRNSSGSSVLWNGVGDYGVANGSCFYRIEASKGSERTSSAMGILFLGRRNESIAKITMPLSRSVFVLGSKIHISGMVMSGTTYDVLYAAGDSPDQWEFLRQSQPGTGNYEDFVVWDTSGLVDVYAACIKLLVHTGERTYSDIVRISFYRDYPEPDVLTETTFTYDRLGRLIKTTYPYMESKIIYEYDRAGNRSKVVRESIEQPTIIGVSGFSARPSRNGVVVQWQTESEVDTAGFNLYRKAVKEAEFEKITPSIIPGRGNDTEGSIYTYTDVPSHRFRNWEYMLEEIETTGKTKMYGPVLSRNISINIQWNGNGAFMKSFNVDCE